MAARVGVCQTCEADVLKSDTTNSSGGDLMLAVGGRLEDTGRKCCSSAIVRIPFPLPLGTGDAAISDEFSGKFQRGGGHFQSKNL